jgi:AraC-like DNA-binding protein
MRTFDVKRFGTLPSATGTLTRLAYARAKEAGIDVDPLLAKVGLTVDQIHDRTTRLRVQSQIAFVEFVAEALQDPFLGFHLARDFDLREIGMLHYVIGSCELLGDALRSVVRYSTILNEGIVLRCSEGDDLSIGFDYVGVARRSDRHQIESWMTTFVRAVRETTGRRIQPTRVRLTHRRNEDLTEFNAFMGVEAQFGADVDEIAFPAAIKDVRLVGADPYLNEILTVYSEEALALRRNATGPLRLSVENAVAPMLPHGRAQLGDVARRLGMGQRTLARRLAAEGTSFNAVVDELKFDLAKRYLADSNLSVSEVAWLLGYQEVSAFTHAFKRWSGTTPRQARAEIALTAATEAKLPS